MLPSSGQLSFSQVIAEFNNPAARSMNQYYGVAPGVPTSGQLSLSHFYGKAYKYYRWWRLWINNTESNTTSTMIVEWELREFVGGADLTTPSTPIGASLQAAAPLHAAASIDGNLNTYWRAGTLNGNTTNQWLVVDLGSPRSVRELAIYGGTVQSDKPRIFELHGSNDGANFTAVAWFNLPGGWPNNTWRTFAI